MYIHKLYLQCYPDRAASKEVMQLLVKCRSHASGCMWEGKLQDIEVLVRPTLLCEYLHHHTFTCAGACTEGVSVPATAVLK